MAAVKINIPDLAESETTVSLSGEKYVFRYHFSSLEQTYYLDIYYQDILVIAGLKLLAGVVITGKYDLPLFDNGFLLVAKLKETSEKTNRNNIGIGKAYELIYITNT
jgi:hypothetical protein